MILKRYHLLFFGFLMSLILPYSINLFFSLKSLSAGFLIGQILLFFSIWVYSEKYLKLFPSTYLSILAFFLLIFSLISELSSQGDILNTLIVIGVVFVVYINVSSLLRLPSEIFYCLIAHSFFFLIILGFISWNLFMFTYRNFILIGEPSLFAMLVGPLGMLYAYKFNHYKLVITIFLIYGIIFPSVIMLSMGIILFLAYLLIHLRILKAISLFIAGLLVMYLILLSLGEGGEYYLERLSLNVDGMNLTSLAYVVQWLNVYDAIANFSYLGAGFGTSPGVVESYDSVYSHAIVKKYGDDITSNIGSTYLTRMFSSIGFGTLIFFFYFVYMAIRIFYSLNCSNDINFSIILLASVVPSFLFRTAGILSFDLFWIILVMILTHKMFNKSYNS